MSGEDYIIRGGVSGRERLKILAAGLAPYTNSLLDDAGIAPGMGVLDAGCGGGDVSVELGRRVGDAGRVVGIDMDIAKIDLAREEASARGVTNIEFRAADFMVENIRGAFDAVYARFLLSHLKDPAAALKAMRAALRPGGMLIVEDVDFGGHFCHPPRASFDNYVAWYQEAARRRGADALLGRRLPELVAGAGFEKLNARAQNPAAFAGPIKQMAALTLSAIADSVVAEKVADRTAVEESIRDLEEASADPSVFMSVPRIVQVWARAS